MKDGIAKAYATMLTESIESEEPQQQPQEEETQEQLVQDKLFGANDYIPFNEEEPMLVESVHPHPHNAKRLIIRSTPGEKTAAHGIVVPRHMWEGTKGTVDRINPKTGKFVHGRPPIPGMNERNVARAKVYGSEHHAPLSRSAITRIHKEILNKHFQKPKHQQINDENEALNRLRAAKHISENADTLDEGEKTDTVKHEYDEHGRSFQAASAKGVAGHAVYTSGHGDDQKHYVINTCPSQTEGCGGGIDSEGLVDTGRGTCFAPKAEAQYPSASIRRACHEQMKHDPKMTQDWILAHVHSLRNAAESADKKNERFLFRPNVVDETDTTSRFAISHLNAQRKTEGKPPIIGNSYGKTNELHDPKNNWYVTYSNTGPKVKNGGEIAENQARDRGRIRETILAVESNGKDKTNDYGDKTPPKNSYLVTNIKRSSDIDHRFQKAVTHAKYWSLGREDSELTKDEQNEPTEAHYDANGKMTTPEKAHYGHVTMVGSDGIERRYDYQKQHVLHPRLVRVGNHDIPTDSRFMDENFLPENRFKTKNGKNAGALIITTPTTSTSDDQHHSNFTHNIDEQTIQHAITHNGEYEIDNPQQQELARNKTYIPPQKIVIMKRTRVKK